MPAWRGHLRSIRSQRGLGMMLAADAMLFGWCLLASLALDFVPGLPRPVAWAAGRGCVRTGLWHVLGGALADDAENRVYPADAAQRRDMDGSGCIFDLFEHVAVVPPKEEDDEGSVEQELLSMPGTQGYF